MDMQGQRVLHVTQAQAWDALNDPEILKSCIPGCDKFELTEANVYSVGVAIKIGPVSAKFSGKVTLSDIQAPNSYALNFEAQGGVAGFGKGESQVSLHPHAEGCELKYTVHSTVGGKLAHGTVGKVMLQGFAHGAKGQFVPRNFGLGEQTRFHCFVTRIKFIAGQAGQVVQVDLPDAGHAHDSEQVLHDELCTGFFGGLACSAL